MCTTMSSIRTNYKERYKSGLSGAAQLLTLMLILAMAIAGCSSSTTDSGDTTNDDNNTGDPGAATSSVTMEGISFIPGDLTVEVGTTVKWTNDSSVIHTVTSGTDGTHDDIFNSGDMGPNDEFSYTFNEVGTFPYFCIPHVNQGMTGTITVIASE